MNLARMNLSKQSPFTIVLKQNSPMNKAIHKTERPLIEIIKYTYSRSRRRYQKGERPLTPMD